MAYSYGYLESGYYITHGVEVTCLDGNFPPEGTVVGWTEYAFDRFYDFSTTTDNLEYLGGGNKYRIIDAKLVIKQRQ